MTIANTNLPQVIKSFLQEERPTLDVNSCAATKGACDSVASDLQHYLAKQGVESSLVMGQGLLQPLGNGANPEWQKFVGQHPQGYEFLVHVVVRVADQIIDLTGAQFGHHKGVVIEPFHTFAKRWKYVKPFKAWTRLASRYQVRQAELHPPLGTGDIGPCFAVQRIRQNIHNLRLREALVRKVESGEGLSNDDIRKVYFPFAEPGATNDTGMLLTAHAQYRMDMRRVRLPFLKLLLKLFTDWLKAHPDVHAYYEQHQWAHGEDVTWKEPKTGLKIAVVKGPDGRFKIITLFYPNMPALTPPGLGRCGSLKRPVMPKYAGEEAVESEEAEEAERRRLVRRHRVRKIMRTISRPQGWKHTDGEPEFDGNDEEWLEDHMATTPGGSVLIGVPHAENIDGESEESQYIRSKVLPKLVAAAEKALNDDKKVVFLAEGQAYNYDLEVDTDYNEQHAIAKILHRKFKHGLQQDTWEDASVDVLQSKSPIWKKLSDAAGDDRDKAQAAIAVYLMAQGNTYPFLKTHAVLNEKVEKLIKKRFGVDLKKDGATEEALEKFHRMSFPRDLGDPHNDISAIGEVYTAARQEALVNKIKKIEDEGGIALVAPGASHVWNLKAVLEHEKPEKKKASLDELSGRYLSKLGFSKSASVKVFLDDDDMYRPTPPGWVRVHWPDEAIKLLQTGQVSEISLDHDLGDDSRGTGNDVILWIEEAVMQHGFDPPRIHIHSANSSAKAKMQQGVMSIQRFLQGR